MPAPERKRLDETLADWIVARLDSTAEGGLRRHVEGVGGTSRDRFTLPEARQFFARLTRAEPDADWRMLHHHTLVTPAEHEDWINGAGKRWSP